jgi:hypothetical protein
MAPIRDPFGVGSGDLRPTRCCRGGETDPAGDEGDANPARHGRGADRERFEDRSADPSEAHEDVRAGEAEFQVDQGPPIDACGPAPSCSPRSHIVCRCRL